MKLYIMISNIVTPSLDGPMLGHIMPCRYDLPAMPDSFCSACPDLDWDPFKGLAISEGKGPILAHEHLIENIFRELPSKGAHIRACSHGGEISRPPRYLTLPRQLCPGFT